MSPASENSLIAAIVAAFVLLLAGRIVNYFDTVAALKTAQGTPQIREATVLLTAALSAVEDVETDTRGYLLTGQPVYLQPAGWNEAHIDSPLDGAAKLIANDPVQEQRLELLRTQITAKLAVADREIDLYQHQGREAAVALVATGRPKQLMDAVRVTIAAMQNRQQELLDEAESRMRRAEERGNVSVVVMSAAELALLVLVTLGAVRHLRDRRQRLGEELALSRAIFDSLGEGLYASDQHGHLVTMNRAAEQIVGYAHPELAGRALHDILHHHRPDGSPYPADQCPILKAAQEGRPLTVEEDVFWHKNGSPVPVAYTSGPIVMKGRIIGAVLAFRDITESKRSRDQLRSARDQAEQANRAKTLFLASMSHELRTPLNAIIGYSEMLLEEMDESARDAAHAADLEKIRAAGRQLLVLINDVLDLSKIEAGKVGLSLETFDVAALVAELKAMVQPAAAKTGNRLEVDCAAEIGTMSADPGKVRQLLLNLLSNALKFTDHGVVRLEASRLARDGREWMTFTVSDTGIGMTGEQMGRLFQAFSQAEEKIAVRFGGTGLGLAISQRLCRLMGGQITVSSELGRGSVFAACVPVNVEPIAAYAEPARQQTADADPPLADTQTAPVVLVVDDDPIARDLLVRTLTACGYAVRAATSGEEGLRLARELRPMAITLDLLMPGLDGWAVLARLKEDEKTANIPVIVISTVGEQARGEGMKRGASEILPKPVERQRLSAILARHCGPQRGGPAAA